MTRGGAVIGHLASSALLSSLRLRSTSDLVSCISLSVKCLKYWITNINQEIPWHVVFVYLDISIAVIHSPISRVSPAQRCITSITITGWSTWSTYTHYSS